MQYSRQAFSNAIEKTKEQRQKSIKETVKRFAHGKSTWDISVLLGISERTVNFHIANIMRKLDASTRAHAVAIAVERGLVDIE